MLGATIKATTEPVNIPPWMEANTVEASFDGNHSLTIDNMEAPWTPSAPPIKIRLAMSRNPILEDSEAQSGVKNMKMPMVEKESSSTFLDPTRSE